MAVDTAKGFAAFDQAMVAKHGDWREWEDGFLGYGSSGDAAYTHEINKLYQTVLQAIQDEGGGRAAEDKVERALWGSGMDDSDVDAIMTAASYKDVNAAFAHFTSGGDR